MSLAERATCGCIVADASGLCPDCEPDRCSIWERSAELAQPPTVDLLPNFARIPYIQDSLLRGRHFPHAHRPRLDDVPAGPRAIVRSASVGISVLRNLGCMRFLVPKARGCSSPLA